MTVTATSHEAMERGIRVAAPAKQKAMPEASAEAPEVHEIDAAHRADADARLEARVAEMIATDAAVKARAGAVHVSVSDGIITLYGAVRDCTAGRDIEAAARQVVRIGMIRNQLHTLGARFGD